MIGGFIPRTIDFLGALVRSMMQMTLSGLAIINLVRGCRQGVRDTAGEVHHTYSFSWSEMRRSGSLIVAIQPWKI
jgi:hypothetical protein